MTAIGGPVKEISWFGRIFSAAQDSNGNRHLGGYQNTKEMNGNFTSRTKMEPKPWYITGLTIEMDDDRGDSEFLQNRCDEGVDGPFTVTYTSNITYSGVGMLVGEHDFQNESSTGSVDFSGGGKLTP